MNAKGHARLPEAETAAQPKAAIETVTIISLAVSALSLVLFAWIAHRLSVDSTARFDRAVREQLHLYATPGLTRAMIGISFLGAGGLAVAASVAVVAFLLLRWDRAALWLAISLLGAVVLELTLKYAFGRLRPPSFFVPPPQTPGFPSGHALVSFCFYGVLAGLLVDRIQSPFLRVVIWICAACLVMAIGISRIYLGVHYPSDVVAGYLTGTLWVSTMITVDRLRARRKQSNP